MTNPGICTPRKSELFLAKSLWNVYGTQQSLVAGLVSLAQSSRNTSTQEREWPAITEDEYIGT